ncbi:MAG TPA: LamG-like jellyroll fold domain-containing protein, partial [Steroidobacteraceae bacterium]
MLAMLSLAWIGGALAGTIEPGTSGPYNLTILQGGIGMTRTLPADTPILRAGAPWSITSWIKIDVPESGPVILAAVGDPTSSQCTCVALDSGRLSVRSADAPALQTSNAIAPAVWQSIAVTYDGKLIRLYVGGLEQASAPSATRSLTPTLQLAPVIGWPSSVQHFGGALAQFQLYGEALSPTMLAALTAKAPSFDLVSFTQVGAGWPVQVKAWIGLTVPQDPWTLPHGHAPMSAPVAVAVSPEAALQPQSDQVWKLGAWRMKAAPGVTAGGAALSQPDYSDAQWYAARVPGTVLSTLIDRGVYPDPDYGLNNMAIPESLARQDYWYRTRFTTPAQLEGKRLTLTFEGINYAAEVWLNGVPLGNIHGAFTRGVFDVTHRLAPGRLNALAVRISP